MDLTALLPQIVPFIRTVGLTIDSVQKGEAIATLSSRPEVHNHIGTCHTGAVYTLAESASGGVVLSMFADLLPDAFIALKSATIHHTKARPGDVVATARLEGDPAATRAAYDDTGRADFDVVVALAVEGQEVARVDLTWAVRAPRG